ncbi:hypothetical protein DSL64_07900 [Dyadobacter luteus]|uniref:Uncharacterized protein n=1 Tax=Dyadobacter luteus TaxID=2259619 RepID=A0A3D8YEA1_9BACT|nr:hypothetical protein [Dyadobacter luteus]REA62836.1 hypothetical protein DSL64_07900 [Dyadobacter luteus]
MTFLRSLRASRYFCIFFAFHLLNLSVDSPDFQPISVAEDLSINDQESLIEFITEHILGFDHLFPETDDDDSNSRSSGLTLYHFPVSCRFRFSPTLLKLESVRFLSRAIFTDPRPIIEGSSPPPEMLLV